MVKFSGGWKLPFWFPAVSSELQFLSRKAKADLGLFYVLLKEIFLYDSLKEEQGLRFLMQYIYFN